MTGSAGTDLGASSTGEQPTTAGLSSGDNVEPPGTTGVGPGTGSETSDTSDTSDMLHCGAFFSCDVPPPECDVWLQDCAAGEKCSAYGQNAIEEIKWSTICTAVAQSPAKLGEPCVAQAPDFEYGDGPGVHSGIDNCDAGLKCWNLDADHHGTCHPLCTGSVDAPVCGENKHCFALDDSEEATHWIDLCFDLCDPLLADCPGANELCLPDRGPFACLEDRWPFENQPGHAQCSDSHQCLPGLYCYGYSDGCDPADDWCCLPYCDLTADEHPACNPDFGETCVKLFGAPSGAEHVGVCSKPE